MCENIDKIYDSFQIIKTELNNIKNLTGDFKRGNKLKDLTVYQILNNDAEIIDWFCSNVK